MSMGKCCVVCGVLSVVMCGRCSSPHPGILHLLSWPSLTLMVRVDYMHILTLSHSSPCHVGVRLTFQCIRNKLTTYHNITHANAYKAKIAACVEKLKQSLLRASYWM